MSAIFDQVEEFRLDNGMLFLLLPRHDVPLVAGNIMVKVGNVDTPVGSTGLAHLFEHMAFKGTDVIGSTDYAAEAAVLDSLVVLGEQLSVARRSGKTTESAESELLETRVRAMEKRAGAYAVPMAFPQTYDKYTFDFNAYTSTDVTAYTANFPANNLEAWMLMESERLKHGVFREFYAELDVVMEERRSRTEDKPEAMAYELLHSLFFTRHPYRFPTIGYMDDLRTLNPGMLRKFHSRYYVPGNMVGVLVGDFDPDQARTLITAYFKDIPSGPLPPEVSITEPVPTAQRRGVHNQGGEKRLNMAFPGFGPRDSRLPTSILLADVLAGNRTSRLARSLDLEAGVARSVWASARGGFRRYAGMFSITVDLMSGHTNQEVEELVWQELQNFTAHPVTSEKLEEIKASYRKDFIFGLQKNDDLADMLASSQTIAGDWRRCYLDLDEFEMVTPEGITTLANALFQPELATVVYLEPNSPDDTEKGSRP